MQTDFVTEVIISTICIAITFMLFFLFFKKKIDVFQLIIYSFACQTYNITFISGTVSPFFFVSIYISINEIILIITGKTLLKKSLVLVLFLPIISSLAVLMLLSFGVNIFEEINPTEGKVLLNCLIFYLKYFLPIVFLGISSFRSSKYYSFENLIVVFKKVAIFSCYIGLIQLFCSLLINDKSILRVIGLRAGYLSYVAGGADSSTARISAFFLEPKHLSSFLVISFPFFLRERKFIPMAFIVVTGILTASQTFVLGIIITVFMFIIINRVKNVRPNIAYTLFAIISLFATVSLLRLFFYDFYNQNKDNYVVRLVLSRAIDRYDVNSEDPTQFEVLGLPLQKDEEWPTYTFFSNKPWLYFSGYGLKNGGYIPLKKYFIFNDPNFRDVGSLSYTLDMRWYYYVCEFGILIFIIWFIYFTRNFGLQFIPPFQRKYYAFLWVILFFSNIELVLVLTYGLYLGHIYNIKKGTTFENLLITSTPFE